MLPFLLLLIGATTVYLFLAIGTALIIRKQPTLKPPLHPSSPSVCVIVAARDEENALPDCLKALQKQRYPSDRLTLMIVDDGSEDASPQLVRSFAEQDPRFKLVATPPPSGSLRGKALALHAALEQSTEELILVTDADCRPPPDWVRNMVDRFEDPDLGIVCGVTTVSHQTRWERMQTLDWLLLLTTASAASEVGFPITAMGNNMAFRRSAYEAVGGYAALPTSVTEDYALFQAVHNHTAWKVMLKLDASLRNTTLPLPDFKAVFQQRKRWARGGLSASPMVYAGYLGIYLTHLFLVVGLFVAPLVTLPLLALKVLADLWALRVGQQRLGVPALLSSFLYFEGYLFLYIIAMPIALLLSPQIHWKGRSYP